MKWKVREDHPKWVLPDETEFEDVVAELKEYVGLKDIKLLDLNEYVYFLA